MLNSQTIFWLVLAVCLGFIEASTPTLVTIWPALASLLTAIFSTFIRNSAWLTIIFILVSALLLICTRPLVKKYINKKVVATNADRIIGMDGIVTVPIDSVNNRGQVKVIGQLWSAKSNTDSFIEANAVVTIVALDGVKVIVKRKENK